MCVHTEIFTGLAEPLHLNLFNPTSTQLCVDKVQVFRKKEQGLRHDPLLSRYEEEHKPALQSVVLLLLQYALPPEPCPAAPAELKLSMYVPQHGQLFYESLVHNF